MNKCLTQTLTYFTYRISAASSDGVCKPKRRRILVDADDDGDDDDDDDFVTGEGLSEDEYTGERGSVGSNYGSEDASSSSSDESNNDDDDDDLDDESEQEEARHQGQKRKRSSGKKSTHTSKKASKKKKKKKQQCQSHGRRNMGKKQRKKAASNETDEQRKKRKEDLMARLQELEDAPAEVEDDWLLAQFDDRGKFYMCKHCKGDPWRKKGKGQIAKAPSNSNVHRHLRQAHPLVKDQRKRPADGSTSGGGGAAPPSSSSKSCPPPCRAGGKITDHAYYGEYESKECHDALVVMCALDNRPFNVVECKGFRFFVDKVSKRRYVLPSRAYLRERTALMSDQLRADLRELIKCDLGNGATFTLTFDCWTDGGMRPFICINAHWVSPDTMTYRQKNLVVQSFPGSHTGEAIAKVVKEAALSYGIPFDKILYCCTDNAANMDVCVEDHMKDGPSVRIYCACHWLQLSVNDAIKESPMLLSVEPLKDYIAYVNKSSLSQQKLEDIQKKYPGRQTRKLVKEVSARWCSRYLMCQRALDLEAAIVAHIADLITVRETQNATSMMADDFKDLRNMTACLLPFYTANMVLEGDEDASISCVFPQLQRILKKLDPTQDLEVQPPVFGWKDGKHQLITPAVKIKVDDLSEEVKQFRELLRVKLVERWGKESKVHHLYGLYLASAFLDHRHRDNPLIDAFRDRGLAQIQKMAIEMMEGNDGGATEVTSGGGGVRFASSHVQSSLTVAQLDFLQGREEMRGGGAAATASEQARREQARARLSKEEITTAVLREMERYNMEPIDFSIMSMSPFGYWRSYSGSFPILSRLAARILSIPASSASCERVFSQAGLTLSKLRTRLGRETVADLMMIKYHHADGKLYYTLKDWEEMKEANNDDEADLVDLIN